MFRTGDTVIFDSCSFNPEFWMSLTNIEKVNFYGRFFHLEYDFTGIDLSHYQPIPGPNWAIPIENCKRKLFTFICEHHPQTGHCVLMDMNTGELLSMCHTNNFRLAADEEC